MYREICNLCERKRSEVCEYCKHFNPVSKMDKLPNYFLLNRHFTIIEMIDKYCEITEKCEDCPAIAFCEQYVMPDIIKKSTKIKKARQQKITNGKEDIY